VATFGKTTVGSIFEAHQNYRHIIRWGHVDTPGAGTINFAKVHGGINAAGGTNQIRVHLYVKGATFATTTLAFSSSIINVTNIGGAWLTVPMTGTLLAATPYIIVGQLFCSVASRCRISSDTDTTANSKRLDDTDFNAPATLAGASNWNRDQSIYIDYTPGGPVVPVASPGRPRRIFDNI
jgi:hypothetical protein